MDVLAPLGSVSFDAWCFDPHLGGLARCDETGALVPVALGTRAVAVLAMLLREPGVLVSKDALMSAVWPGISVEPNNLTVQIAAIRRVLDEGRGGASYIQTVPGRGYRFVAAVSPFDGSGGPAPTCLPEPAWLPETVPSPRSSPDVVGSPRHKAVRPVTLWASALTVLLLMAVGGYSWLTHETPPRRLSLVMLPFENLTGAASFDRLTSTLSDDLFSAMSERTSTFAISRAATARTDPRQIGRDHSSRLILAGSVRALAGRLSLTARLVSAEDASEIWSERLEFPPVDPETAERIIIERLGRYVWSRMITFDASRIQVAATDIPDPIDLWVRAQALLLQPPNADRMERAHDLLERAFGIDPSSPRLRLSLVNVMLDDEEFHPQGSKVVFERTSQMLSTSTELNPAGYWTAVNRLHWLHWLGTSRCPETIELARHVIERYPAVVELRRWLADCQTKIGRAEDALPELERAMQLGDGDHNQSHNYSAMQRALLLLGRFEESIGWGERALAANPEDAGFDRARASLWLAAAYALTGRFDDAHSALGRMLRITPHATLRLSLLNYAANPSMTMQLGRLATGLRLAGLLDHADEAADFGAPPDRVVHQEFRGLTPVTVPGAKTILTHDLPRLLATPPAIVIDTVASSGRSIPGAIGLRYVGDGGNLSDIAQDHLRTKMIELTHGALATPIVAVGWNAGSFTGRNLAVRLVALGYTNVYWYRGGREAWEVEGLPEADLVEQDW